MIESEKGEPKHPRSRAFVSYSLEDNEHKIWVRNLATRLRSDGVDVTLDQWHAIPGDQIPAFMERAVRENDFVLIICTPTYKRKSEQRVGGVGYEGDIMTSEVFATQNHRKFIPVLRGSDWHHSAPGWLTGKFYVDLRDNPFSEKEYSTLVLTLHGALPEPPPLGEFDAFRHQQQSHSPSISEVDGGYQGEIITVQTKDGEWHQLIGQVDFQVTPDSAPLVVALFGGFEGALPSFKAAVERVLSSLVLQRMDRTDLLSSISAINSEACKVLREEWEVKGVTIHRVSIKGIL